MYVYSYQQRPLKTLPAKVANAKLDDHTLGSAQAGPLRPLISIFCQGTSDRLHDAAHHCFGAPPTKLIE